MNIVIFSDTYLPHINGVATSASSLREVLLRHGHKVLVVTINPTGKDVIFEKDTIRIPGLEFKKIYGYRLAWLYNQKAAKKITEFHPDLFHIQTEFGIGIFGQILAKKLKVATVYTYHTMFEDYSYYVTKGHFDQAVRTILRTYTKNMVDNVNEVIVPSVKIKDYFRQIKVDKYINIVPTGLDLEKFDNKNFDINEVNKEKERIGIKPDDKVLFSLGRVAKEKSIDVCLKGFANYLKKYKDKHIKFLIVGSGPDIDEFIKLSKELGIDDKTIFLGAVENTKAPFYYQLGDYFVSASISETQGLTFMEAMASSLPILARFDTNLLGVIEDNKSGIFFIDEDDFADKLNKLIHLPNKEKEEIIKNAKEKVEPFSIEKFYENVMGVYNRAIKKNW